MSAALLPETLPIFPLSGALLLPRGRLPLNIFEPRYLQMVEHALGRGRLIGMVQPMSPESEHVRPPVYEIGCAGRISSFAETDDGRYLITLAGVARFRIDEELEGDTLYRRVRASFAPFADDLAEPVGAALDRARLMNAIRAYAGASDMDLNWQAIDGLGDEALINALAMACSFHVQEKQALLEAPDLAERARTLVALLEMASVGAADEDTRLQ